MELCIQEDILCEYLVQLFGMYEACLERKDTKVLTMYSFFTLQN
jgi:hypothetical protein